MLLERNSDLKILQRLDKLVQKGAESFVSRTRKQYKQKGQEETNQKVLYRSQRAVRSQSTKLGLVSALSFKH
jgi:hypothetical protein